MKRRAVFSSIGVGLLSQAVPALRDANAQSEIAPRPEFTAADYEPFKKIAAAKGVKVFINSPAASKTKALEALHLDMDMVRASLALAIRDARKKGKTKIAEKLERLSKSGTAVQQVEFVTGTGTYYFPEDIEKAISLSGKEVEAKGIICETCDWVCTTVCTCQEHGDQYCKDKCRTVCSKYC